MICRNARNGKRTTSALGKSRGELTPLPWADPPFSIVQRLLAEARAVFPKRGTNDSTHARKVSAEFDRRLAAAGILVEGM